jgi:hypothetical protein
MDNCAVDTPPTFVSVAAHFSRIFRNYEINCGPASAADDVAESTFLDPRFIYQVYG